MRRPSNQLDFSANLGRLIDLLTDDGTRTRPAVSTATRRLRWWSAIAATSIDKTPLREDQEEGRRATWAVRTQDDRRGGQPGIMA